MSDIQIDKQTLLAIRKDGKLGGYAMARIDESGAHKYYGFLNPKGDWYLMVIKSTGEVQYYNEDKKDPNKAVATLITAFGTAWTARASVTYREFPYCQII